MKNKKEIFIIEDNKVKDIISRRLKNNWEVDELGVKYGAPFLTVKYKKIDEIVSFNTLNRPSLNSELSKIVECNYFIILDIANKNSIFSKS